MVVARSGVSLLLGLTALAVAGGTWAEPPPGDPGKPPAEAPRAASQPPPPKPADKAQQAKEAMALHDEAWVLYEQGRYRAAIDKLEAAVRIDPDGRELVYNLALLHEKLADHKEAITHYRRYLEMETDPKARAAVQATLRRLEGAEREAKRTSAAPVLAPLPPPPPRELGPRPLRPGVVAAGSVAGIATVIGAIFGVRAVTRNPGSSPSTGGGVTVEALQAQARSAHGDAVACDVSFAVGAVAAATALVLYYATPRAVVPVTTGPTARGPRVATGPGLLQVRF